MNKKKFYPFVNKFYKITRHIQSMTQNTPKFIILYLHVYNLLISFLFILFLLFTINSHEYTRGTSKKLQKKIYDFSISFVLSN